MYRGCKFVSCTACVCVCVCVCVSVCVSVCNVCEPTWADGVRYREGVCIYVWCLQPTSPEHKNSWASHSGALTLHWLCTHTGWTHTPHTPGNTQRSSFSRDDAVCPLSSPPDGEDASKPHLCGWSNPHGKIHASDLIWTWSDAVDLCFYLIWLLCELTTVCPCCLRRNWTIQTQLSSVFY